MVNPSEAGFILRFNADPVLPCLPGQPSDPPGVVDPHRDRHGLSSTGHARSGRVHLETTPLSLLTITHNFRELRERPKGQGVDTKKGAADNKLGYLAGDALCTRTP